MGRKKTEQFFLMHKDVKVCLMDISEDGNIGSVRYIDSTRRHIPIGAQMNDIKFHEWWRDRAIPKTRHGAECALQKLGYQSTQSALIDNLALSLSDCYWIMPRDESLTWKDVNLFSNDFVDTFGEITFNQDTVIDLRNKTKFSCAASQGELQKKWCIDENGKRYMVKGNYGQSYQQSINELFATKLHEQQNFLNHTVYKEVLVTLDNDVNGMGCMSYDFCSENLEMISAWEVLQTVKTRQNESLYFPLKAACLSLGIKEREFDEFMDYEIMTDYLLTNTDRHMNNISIIRNPDTLEILGFAPIYDSGNSMFFNIPFSELGKQRFSKIETHSFVKHEMNLLSYVKNRTALCLDQAEMDFSIYNKDVEERHIRIPALKALYEKKMEYIHAFQSGKNIWNMNTNPYH